MKKAEFIKAVSEKLEITQIAARTLTEGVFEVAGDALVSGKQVSLGDLGKLEVVVAPARKARNPQTGESIDVPAKNRIRYKASKYGKDLVQ